MMSPYNPRPWEVEDQEFKESLGYMRPLCKLAKGQIMFLLPPPVSYSLFHSLHLLTESPGCLELRPSPPS